MIKTLTNQEIVNIYEGIQRLREASVDALPVKVGFTLVKDANILQPLYDAVISMRDTVALKYGENDNGVVTIPPEFLEQANAELQELGSVENEVDVSYIPLAAISNLSLPLDIIYNIYPIIDENGET